MSPSRRSADAALGLAGLWGLSALQAAKLEKHCRSISVHRGEAICRRGDRLPGAFAVTSGTVKLSLHGHDEERVLRIVGEGETFGEAVSVLSKPSPYDASALSDASLVAVPPAAMWSLLRRDARFAKALVTKLAESVLEMLSELEAATTQRSAQRLATYLESLARLDGASGPCTVKLPVSKTVVAARLGVKKETLSRLLKQFSGDGIIGVTRREIMILDPDRLSAAAQEAPREHAKA
ncbi:MAG TPA: Crp/Fnr family transcriptional regulator [Burkholderiales bacterium]